MPSYISPRRILTVSALVLCMSNPSIAADEGVTAPAQADSFEREALALLKSSFESKHGIVLHVNGEAIAGVVKAIGPDVVIMSSREFDKILVRRDRIEAIEAY